MQGGDTTELIVIAKSLALYMCSRARPLDRRRRRAEVSLSCWSMTDGIIIACTNDAARSQVNGRDDSTTDILLLNTSRSLVECGVEVAAIKVLTFAPDA
jgi:hypothetical protein